MNKGKENYQNIPLPDGLSDAVRKGIKKGKRHMEKKWIAAAGTLAAACVLGFVVLKALPADSLRTPTENDPASQARMADSQNGQTPEAAAYGLPEDASADSAAPASMDDASEADPSMEGPAAEQTAPSSLRVTGTIAEISDDQILLKNEEEGAAYPEILLNLTEDTLILSAADCSEKALSDFAVGDTVYADVSPVMTRSLPPMTNAFTLFCEIPEDTAVPAYGTITDVSADEDGNLRVSTDQDLILNLTPDAPVLSLDGTETLSAAGLMAGDTILVRYSFMTMSIPAQTTPDEIRLVAQAPAVAEEKPARTRKSKAAAKPAEAPAEEAPKAEEKPAEAPAPAAEAKPAAKPAVLKPRADGGMLREITPRPQQAGNPYKPMLATVVETIQETGNIKTLRVVLDDPEQMANFTYEPGQVGQLSVFGAGESTFVINTPPSQKEYLQFSVMQAGEVTSAIHRLSPGDKVGVRAPLGNFFPYNDWKGKNIFFVGGGIGMAPIRTIMLHVLEHKADYGKVSLLYGARSPRDMAFSYELEGWLANPDLDCTLCIDNPYEGWPHKVGLIPNVLTELNPSPDNCVAVLCGPPIMIKFTLQALEKLGFPT